MNKSIQLRERINRLLSVLLIYAFLISDFVSFARAMTNESGLNKKAWFITNTSVSEPSQTVLETVNSTEFVSNKTTAKHEALESNNKAEVFAMAPSSGGPTQSESSGFSLSSTDGMVDKFTGDFTYSIPLMDVEGYPIVLNYNSNIGMNEEASWVGLGWDLNVGSVSRDMRGIPDEFNGDQKVTKTISQLDNNTDGSKFGGYVAWQSNSGFSIGDVKLYPNVQLTLLFGKYSNPYIGNAKTFDFGLQAAASIGEDFRFGPKFGFGFDKDSKNGIGRNTTFGVMLGQNFDRGNYSLDFTYGRSFNSRAGLMNQSIGLGADGSYQVSKNVGAGSTGIGNTTSYGYGTITSVPSVRFKTKGQSTTWNLNGYIRGTIAGSTVTAGLIYTDYVVNSVLKYTDGAAKTFSQPAYGFFHSGKRNASQEIDQYPIMDFNRTADYELSENMKNLSFSFQTYDVFSVSAMGLSGSFRARRTDFGTYRDPSVSDTSKGKVHSPSAGVVLGPGKVQIELGYSEGSQKGLSESGIWGEKLNFDYEPSGTSFDESVYFKSMGEATPEDLSALNLLGGAQKGYVDVNANSNEIELTNYLKLGNSGVTIPSILPLPTNTPINSANAEPIIATDFTPLIANQAVLETGSSYPSYPENTFGNPSATNLNRITTQRAQNHLSVIKAKSTNGTEYTYGVPAYSIVSNNVMFAVDNNPNPATGIVTYDLGDNTIYNTKGRSNLFDKTSVPAYPQAFLLTEMKSSDYVDITGNGPSVDDIGSYYKFNHTRIYGSDNSQTPFKWRFPVSDQTGPQALFNEGFEGTDLDNTASYTYGEKEIWYTHSVESKNLIAEFYLENREDAYGVQTENGEIDLTKPLRRLKKIVLYNKSERLSNPSTAIPLQTVEFEYDYSQCRNNPSNRYSQSGTYDYTKSGKLTLKRIRVYSGNSNEGALASYDFNYTPNNVSNPNLPYTENPDFNYGAVDGWGNYKANVPSRPNSIFPYAEQNLATADNNIQAWKLHEITNPLGGKITINYEADRYITVQDKRTMRHFDIEGMTSIFDLLYLMNEGTWNGTDRMSMNMNNSYSSLSAMYANLLPSGTFWNPADYAYFVLKNFTSKGTPFTAKFGKFDEKLIPNNVIIFELDQQLSQTNFPTMADASAEVKNRYFKTGESDNPYIKDIFFKAHVKMMTQGGEEVTEYVPVFAEVASDYNSDPFGGYLPYNDEFLAIGTMPPNASGEYRYGYVVINPTNSGARERKNTNGDDKSGKMLHPIQRSSIDFARQNLGDRVYGNCAGCPAPDISLDNAAFWGGDIYENAIQKGNYASELIDFSTVRLYVPDSIKFGGNARVKSITYTDSWNSISGEAESGYIWNYLYPDRDLSSGVASYEPGAIIDESDFYHWDTYVNAAKKFPDQTQFTPTPVTGALFPVPIVGYSEVRVTFSGGLDNGYSKSQFFTARDYPTVEKITELEKSDVSKSNIITGNTKNFFGFTQGFVVETNNFHGQPKEFSIHDDQDFRQSRTTYRYDALGTKVKMIDRKGIISDENIAMEYDVHADARFITDVSTSYSIGAMLRFTIPTFFPFKILPNLQVQKREREFYSHVLVKHINRSAVVRSIETEYMGSINTARNILYDKYSGNVLLSSLNDEYDDELYSMSYPSHWYYPELRDVNSANGKSYSGTINGSALFVAGMSENDIFTPGDQLSITNGSSTVNAVVIFVSEDNASLITPTGASYSGIGGNVTVTINKTGRDNRLFEIMQSTTTKKNIPVSVGSFTFPIQEILSSSVLTYRDKNNIRCIETGDKENGIQVVQGATINPFNVGARGDLVMDGQFAWQSERSNVTANHRTRFDGSYSTFAPFYALSSSGQWKQISQYGHPQWMYGNEYQNWRKLGEVAKFDEYGKATESKDQISVRSSALYGYNKELSILPVAQAVNAKQQQIAFDGFEDYTYYPSASLNYQETHFDFKNVQGAGADINSNIRHSGLSSFEIEQSTSVSVTKGIGEEPCTPANGGLVHSGDGDIPDITFQAQECLCLAPFEPTPGEYLVGAWIRKSQTDVLSYTDVSVDIAIDGSTIGTFAPTGPIIDGWQRVEAEFTIPPTATTITVSLSNNSDERAYFDDLRIHPFLAGMTTTVYDPKTLLPMASHDGYNFTTFYNYDENLNLVRVRVETIEGIKTISESELGGKKKFNN